MLRAGRALRRLLALGASGAAVLGAVLLVGVPSVADVLTVGPTAAPPRTRLLGRSELFHASRLDSSGRAHAFRFVDRVPGAARAVTVYVGPASRSRRLIAGVYSDRTGRPRSLLSTGRATVRRRGRWLTVGIPRTRLVRGRVYWFALLGTGGALETRAGQSSSCRSVTDRAAGLRALPRTWQSDGTSATCVSAYVSGSPSTATSVPVAPPGSPTGTGSPTSTTGSRAATGTTGTTGAIPPPAALTPPAVSGTAATGSTLSATPGSWSGSPSAYAYQWRDCASPSNCTNISGATATSYTVRSSDMGDALEVVVTATNAGGSTAAASAPTRAVPGTGQSVAFWLAWSGQIQESQIPWDAVTQVDLFSLTTTTATSGCSSDCTSLDTSQNGLSAMNVPAWVATIHSHGKLAILSIGGSTDQDWANACASQNVSGFTSELVNYMVSNGFDGVDIDIESLQGSGSQLTLWASCVQAIAQAAHAATTQAGRSPIVSTDVDQSWMDAAVATFERWPDQFNLMYYGYPTGSYSCANACAQVRSLVQGMHTTGHVPYDEMVLGMSPGGNQAQCCYNDLATTAATVDTGGPVTAIPLSSGLSAALPAGDVVLASGENPPAHDEIFTTSGAAQGATSIPITGEVSGSGANAFGPGSEVQSAYAGPWDCGNFAQYAASAGLEGVMIWDLQEEAAEHNGQFPCFAQVAPDVGSPP